MILGYNVSKTCKVAQHPWQRGVRGIFAGKSDRFLEKVWETSRPWSHTRTHPREFYLRTTTRCSLDTSQRAPITMTFVGLVSNLGHCRVPNAINWSVFECVCRHVCSNPYSSLKTCVSCQVLLLQSWLLQGFYSPHTYLGVPRKLLLWIVLKHKFGAQKMYSSSSG